MQRGRGNSNYKSHFRGRYRPPSHSGKDYRVSSRSYDFHGRENYYSKPTDSNYYGDYSRSSRGRSSSQSKRLRSSSRHRSHSRSRSRSRSSRSRSRYRSPRSRSRSPYKSRSRSASYSSRGRKLKSRSRSIEYSVRSRSRTDSRSKNVYRNTSSSSSRSSSSNYSQTSINKKSALDEAKLKAGKDDKAKSPPIDLSLRITVGNEKYLEHQGVNVENFADEQVASSHNMLKTESDIKLKTEKKAKRIREHNDLNNLKDNFSVREQSFVTHPYSSNRQESNTLMETEIMRHISAMPSYLKDDMSKKEWLLNSLSGVLGGRKINSGVEQTSEINTHSAVQANTSDYTSSSSNKNDISFNSRLPQTSLQQSSLAHSNINSYQYFPGSGGVDVGNTGVVGRDSSLPLDDEDLYLYGDEGIGQTKENKENIECEKNSMAANLDAYDNSYEEAVQQPATVASQLPTLLNDPTIGSILKSIGFSFNSATGPSLQTSLENSIDQGSSFLSGGIPSVDIGKVFSKEETDAPNKKKRRTVPESYETYEERARKYREEQLKAMSETLQNSSELYSETKPIVNFENLLDSFYSYGDKQQSKNDSNHQAAYSGLDIIQQYDSHITDNSRILTAEKDYYNSGYGEWQHKSSNSIYPDGKRQPVSDNENVRWNSSSNIERDYGHRDDYKPFVTSNVTHSSGAVPIPDDRLNYFPREKMSPERVKRKMSKKELDALKREVDIKYKRLKLLDRELGRIRRQKSDIMMRPKWEKLSELEEETLHALNREENSLLREISALQTAADDCEKQIEEGRTLLAEQQKQEEFSKKKLSDAMLGKSLEVPKSETDEKKVVKIEAHSALAAAESSKKELKCEADDNVHVAIKDKKRLEIQMEFTDGGNHWCKVCNLICKNIDEFCKHLHDKKHRKLSDIGDCPWVTDVVKTPLKPASGKAVVVPYRGAEFTMGVRAFYCSLCREFMGDGMCVMTHLKTKRHDDKYQQYVADNPVYEKNLNLEKNACLARLFAEGSVKREEDAGNDDDNDDSKSKRKKNGEKDTEAKKILSDKDIESKKKSSSDKEIEIKKSSSEKESFRNKEAGSKRGTEKEYSRSRDIEERSKKLLQQSDDYEKKRMTVGEPGTKQAGRNNAFADFIWKSQSQKKIRVGLNSSDSDSESAERKVPPKDIKSSEPKNFKIKIQNKSKKKTDNKESLISVPVSKSKWELDEDDKREPNEQNKNKLTAWNADNKATRDLAAELLRKKAETKANKSENVASLDMFLSESSGKPVPVMSESGSKISVIISSETSQSKALEDLKWQDSKELSKGKDKKQESVKYMGKGDLKPTPPPQMASPSVSKKPNTSLSSSAAKDLYGVFFNENKGEENELAKSIENARKAAMLLAGKAGTLPESSPISTLMPTLADKQNAANTVKKASTKVLAKRPPPPGVIIAPLKSLKIMTKIADKPTTGSGAASSHSSVTQSGSTVTSNKSAGSKDNEDAKSDTSELSAGDFDIVDEL